MDSEMIDLVKRETQLVELVAHVAQQLQRGKDVNIYLDYLRYVFQNNPKVKFLDTLITSFDVFMVIPPSKTSKFLHGSASSCLLKCR
jgi:hypothetical protein